MVERWAREPGWGWAEVAPGAGQLTSAGGSARAGDQGPRTHGRYREKAPPKGNNIQTYEIELQWFICRSPSHLLDMPQPRPLGTGAQPDPGVHRPSVSLAGICGVLEVA